MLELLPEIFLFGVISSFILINHHDLDIKFVLIFNAYEKLK